MSENRQAVYTKVKVPEKVNLSFLGPEPLPSLMLHYLSKFGDHRKSGIEITSMWGIASLDTMGSLLKMDYVTVILKTSATLLNLDETIFLAFYSDKELGKRSWEEYLELVRQFEVRTDI